MTFSAVTTIPWAFALHSKGSRVMTDWSVLQVRLKAAIGPDAGIDAAIAEAFGTAPAGYTGSAAECRGLVAAVLPDWHLHVGADGAGGKPYATLSKDDHHIEAEAPMVSLAILRCLAELANLKT